MPATPPTGAIEQVRLTIDQRIEELRPLVEEYRSLTEFRERAIRPYLDPKPKRIVARRVHKPVSQRVLEIVSGHPEGVSVSDLASEAHTGTGYIYAVARKLEEQGKVRRKDGKVFPT